MAAGPGAASSGHGSGRASSGGFEASLDRRFQGISNTMDSIQGLCGWCIENKKHHSLIARYWMKWLKKSDASHRLNLFYLANDVIQNCKRKNAIVFRTTFADVLPNAALLVRDAKVHRSVERIFTIWQERNVYPEEFITELKANLAKKEQPQPQPQPPAPPVNPKTALKSKVVAEFAPQAFIDQLVSHQRTLEETDLRQKQLAALRVDVCNVNSAEALKRLKDKAGGKKFSSDFEEGSVKLQEFVTFLEGQMKSGPPLLESLSNADIFYEMQYKEVKIVANAYKTFANRVSNLKRKLDTLRSTLPDLDDSPIPSPSEDAPSPTGSESPFHGLGASRGGPQLDGRGKDIQTDNRDVEDMDLSEEEEPTSLGIIVEEKRERPSTSAVSKATTATPAAASRPTVSTATSASKAPVERSANQTPPSTTTPTPTTPTAATGPSPLQVNLANVDLGKISSILSSLTSAMKGSGVSPAPRPSPTTPTPPSSQSTASKTPVPTPTTPPAANPLASILSRVDITPEGILSALSKTQAHGPGLQGLSSLLHSVSGASSATQSTSITSTPQLSSSSTVTSATATTPTVPKTKHQAPSNSAKRDLERERMREWEKVKEREREKEREKERELERQRERERERQRERERERERAKEAAAAAMPSLDSKIHTFLQGNPAFGGLGLDDGDPSGSPLLVGDNGDGGTPVRDEAAATPTQDEMMDPPAPPTEVRAHLGDPPKHPQVRPGLSLSPTAYRSDLWDAVISPRELLSDARPKDGDYRPNALRHQAFPNTTANAGVSGKKALKASGRQKEDEAVPLKRKVSAAGSSSLEQRAKLSRKASGSSEDGRSEEGEEKGKRGGKELGMAAPGGGGGEGRQYHRIETVVSSNCGEGTPIQTLGTSLRRPSGERIQTVEGIRVFGRGVRRGGGVGARGADAWYEEQAFLEDAVTEAAEELSASGAGLPPLPAMHMPPPPPPHPHLPQGAYQPPYGPDDPHQHAHPHAHTHPHALPPQHQHQHQQSPQMQPPHPSAPLFFPPPCPLSHSAPLPPYPSCPRPRGSSWAPPRP